MDCYFKIALLLVAVSQVIGLSLLFLGVAGGFDDAFDGTSGQNLTDSNYKEYRDVSVVPKVVLMVIDALRTDMATPENFPFLLSSAKSLKFSGVIEYNVSADSPTVTLPRIKAIITGKAPSYMDVIRNLQTSDDSGSSNKLNQDNVISNLRRYRQDFSICFFGDDTWLRLFPVEKNGNSQYFKKWEGVSSFFVKDFYEVDNNVTRHISTVTECDFLILHYLGLDHIGHVFGPKSRPDLIFRKLQEMDSVVKRIFSKFRKLESPSVLLVTGDHGMANVGGHGGSSVEEITTPLIALIQGVRHLKSHIPPRQSIDQVDIAPTLSSLFGLPIPKESTGRIILDLVEPFRSSQSLGSLYQHNCEHLLNKLKNSRTVAKYKLWLSEISKMEKPLSIKKYIELENELGLVLSEQKLLSRDLSSGYILGVFVLVIPEMFLIISFVKFLSRDWDGKVCGVFLSFLPALFLYFSSSFIEEEHYFRYFGLSALLLVWISVTYPLDNTCIWTFTKVLVLHRAAMSFNQTGDKWSFLPDVNDSVMQHNLQWLTACVGVFQIHRFMKLSLEKHTYFSYALFGITSLKIILCFTDYNSSKFFSELRLQQLSLLVIFVFMLTNLRAGSGKAQIYPAFILLVSVLLRLENIILLGLSLEILQSLIFLFYHQYQLHEKFKIHAKSSHILSQVTIIWLIHCSFFYQGNSNSLSTVDVNAGFVGLSSFVSSHLIGILMFVHTYALPFSLYLYLHTIRSNALEVFKTQDRSNCNGNATHAAVPRSSLKSVSVIVKNPLPLLVLMSNGAEAIVYCVTLLVFKNHLFIWSVFVPKLLYLITQSVMHSVLMLVHLFF